MATANSNPPRMTSGKMLEDVRTTAETLPVITRLYYACAVVGFQKLFLAPLRVFRSVHQYFNPPKNCPDITKAYACRPKLPIRIFFPKSYNKSSPHPLPLLLTIHGGGFVLGDPTDSDEWNYTFANMHSALVVALNYSKAPSHPFPTAAHDLEALVRAVLSDAYLAPHMDMSRVALVGWSAGGNLALSIAQLPSVRRVVGAVVPCYPVVDFTAPRELKAATRRWKPELGGFRAKTTDYLFGAAPKFDWAYVPAGHDYRDALLSPYFAEREALPKRVFVISCEMDMLAQEGWRMACRLAGREVPGLEEVVGKEGVSEGGKLILDDERFHFEERGEDGSSYRWLLVPDTIHGFDQPIDMLVRDPVLMKDAKAKTKQIMKLIGDWLYTAG